MATKREGGLSSDALRQSLGPPVRIEVVATGGGPAKKKSKPLLPAGGASSKPPGGYGGSRHSMAMGQSKRPLSSQQQRRQTHVVGSSRVSAGRSSMYGQAGQVKKDPRPLSDKAYQTASIKKLIAYLGDKGYPMSLTVRMLQTPSTKEFLHILNFLLEPLDESLVVNGMNFVEEVPRVLKVLKYPFTVSKNHLLNVGSPHSWPILLGVLSWLVNCSNELDQDRAKDMMFPSEHGFSDEEINTDEAEFQITKMMYGAFMAHGDDSADFRDLVEKRVEVEKTLCDRVTEELARTREENRTLGANIEELSRSSVTALQQQIHLNQEHYDELKRYIESDLSHGIQQLQADIAHMETAFSETEVQIDATKLNVAALEETVRLQPMNANDAHELHEDIREATEMREKYRKRVKDSENTVGELQMQHNRSVLVIDDECGKVNDILRRLGADLPDAATILPLDYDTANRSDPEVLHKLVSHARTIRQESLVLHQRVAAEVSELENQIISGEATQSTLHSEQVKKQLEIDNVQHSLDIEKDALEQRKAKYEEALKTQQAEKHALEKQLMSLQQRILAESSAQRELAVVKRRVESETAALNEKMKVKTASFQKYLVSLSKYTEVSQRSNRRFRKSVDEAVLKFNALKIPTVEPKYLARPDTTTDSD